VHLLVDEKADAKSLLQKAHELLRKEYGFYFSIIQIETECAGKEYASDLDITHSHQ